MTRTPFRRKPAVTHTEQGLVIAGKPWPASWLPEEPNRKVHETSWRETVEQRAHAFGWEKQWHCRLTQQSAAGWFDEVFLRPGKALFVELKVRDRKGKANGTSKWQDEYIYAAIRAGLDVRVWTWPDDDEECWVTLGGPPGKGPG